MEIKRNTTLLRTIPFAETELLNLSVLKQPGFEFNQLTICNAFTRDGCTFDLYTIVRGQTNVEENRRYQLKSTKIPIGASLIITDLELPSLDSIDLRTYIHIDNNIDTEGVLDLTIIWSCEKASFEDGYEDGY